MTISKPRVLVSALAIAAAASLPLAASAQSGKEKTPLEEAGGTSAGRLWQGSDLLTNVAPGPAKKAVQEIADATDIGKLAAKLPGDRRTRRAMARSLAKANAESFKETLPNLSKWARNTQILNRAGLVFDAGNIFTGTLKEGRRGLNKEIANKALGDSAAWALGEVGATIGFRLAGLHGSAVGAVIGGISGAVVYDLGLKSTIEAKVDRYYDRLEARERRRAALEEHTRSEYKAAVDEALDAKQEEENRTQRERIQERERQEAEVGASVRAREPLAAARVAADRARTEIATARATTANALRAATSPTGELTSAIQRVNQAIDSARAICAQAVSESDVVASVQRARDRASLIERQIATAERALATVCKPPAGTTVPPPGPSLQDLKAVQDVETSAAQASGLAREASDAAEKAKLAEQGRKSAWSAAQLARTRANDALQIANAARRSLEESDRNLGLVETPLTNAVDLLAQAEALKRQAAAIFPFDSEYLSPENKSGFTRDLEATEIPYAALQTAREAVAQVVSEIGVTAGWITTLEAEASSVEVKLEACPASQPNQDVQAAGAAASKASRGVARLGELAARGRACLESLKPVADSKTTTDDSEKADSGGGEPKTGGSWSESEGQGRHERESTGESESVDDGASKAGGAQSAAEVDALTKAAAGAYSRCKYAQASSYLSRIKPPTPRVAGFQALIAQQRRSEALFQDARKDGDAMLAQMALDAAKPPNLSPPCQRMKAQWLSNALSTNQAAEEALAERQRSQAEWDQAGDLLAGVLIGALGEYNRATRGEPGGSTGGVTPGGGGSGGSGSGAQCYVLDGPNHGSEASFVVEIPTVKGYYIYSWFSDRSCGSARSCLEAHLGQLNELGQGQYRIVSSHPSRSAARQAAEKLCGR